MQEKTLTQNSTATSDIELHLSLHLQQQTPYSASCILNFKWTQPSINIFQEPATASFFSVSIQQPPKPLIPILTRNLRLLPVHDFHLCLQPQLITAALCHQLRLKHPAWTLILAVFSSNPRSPSAAAAWRLKHPLPEDSDSLPQHHKLFSDLCPPPSTSRWYYNLQCHLKPEKVSAASIHCSISPVAFRSVNIQQPDVAPPSI